MSQSKVSRFLEKAREANTKARLTTNPADVVYWLGLTDYWIRAAEMASLAEAHAMKQIRDNYTATACQTMGQK